MVYLAFIFHMHQPYYKSLLTQETDMPWVRLHGTKDYMDMVRILKDYSNIRQTFNLVPSLLEQVEDYTHAKVKDRFFALSRKPAKDLDSQEKEFILNNFFSINVQRVIATYPRYYELYHKKQNRIIFTEQDFLDLQVWFNLAWIDPSFRKSLPVLQEAVRKARFYTEREKQAVLDAQVGLLNDIIPTYREFLQKGQIEVTVTPYYHPILPLLYNTSIAQEANLKTVLPKTPFSYPEDARTQIADAVTFFRERFGQPPQGMWPSEEAVSEHILGFIMEAGIRWIVTDEAILFKSLKKKKRDSRLVYQPYSLKREEGALQIVFRDKNLSDMIGFVYPAWQAKDAVADFMKHLENIARSFKDENILVTIAMDGENAWEYYDNDGHDFLNLLYARLSESNLITTTTVSEYLEKFPPSKNIKHLAAGSWIYGEFGKWIGNAYKRKAWEWLAAARNKLEEKKNALSKDNEALIWKQMYILEGSDWFWWYGEDPQGAFDKLFRMHLENFYTLIDEPAPEYVKHPLTPE